MAAAANRPNIGIMDWNSLDAFKYQPEHTALKALLAGVPLDGATRRAIHGEAMTLVRTARARARRGGVIENFLQEFSLDTQEGLALMCLAEALLRTPDQATQDRLIAEAVGGGDWKGHLGRSDSLFVNASTWGLMLTGRLVEIGGEAAGDLPGFLRRTVARAGAPVIRAAIVQAVRIMSEQFVLGRTIDEALRRAEREGFLCSFDMLGEGARTADDAARYEAAYERALGAIAAVGAGRDGPEDGHGISVKLSALSPRYEPLQEERVWDELYPRLLRLARRAADANINMTLDAEEADRLVLSLTLLERLAGESVLGSWRGLGLAVQAYQTRAVHLIDRLAELARATGRRLMVRLVKGAYWDSEIKRAQVAGRPGYPVFTAKPATDLSYLICASRLIAAAPALHAQFATHNGHTLASVRAMAVRRGVQVEYQRLHGMGEALYAAAQELFGPMRVRTYAPVGAHEDLLPYLVRRLLENGANTSFVRQLLNDDVPPEDVVTDPITAVEAAGAQGHPRLPLPVDLYGDRRNSLGVDMSVASERARLVAAVRDFRPEPEDGGAAVLSPATGMVVGHIAEATAAQIDAAFAAARAAQGAWDGLGGPGRAPVLERMADALEGARERLIALCVLEAGKTYVDAIAEVREAADFCRYYALLARRQFAGEEELKGPAGERNFLSRHGRGVFACISPWNFPLAIFTGQLAAALAAGNAVLAKPAEQTPLVAREAVRLFHGAGLPRDVLHLVPGDGRVGERLVTHQDCDGVAFTGGTDTARRINRLLAERRGPIVPFIAETGGLNAAFVDTSAQREQVLDDVMLSAFGSAGQRCSALRLLFLPHETADQTIEGLKGAMATLVVGNPACPKTDVGPVIDAEARDDLERHLERLAREAKILHRLPAPATGTFFAPVLAEIASAQFLTREVFGPILHVVRYDPRQAETVARDFAGNGYGLTLGIHSRVESFAETIRRAVPAGNTYVNRSIIGAVVGVQPFGGEGLSGTGPKAGGPLALSRFCVERALSINIAARGGDPALLNL